MEAAVERAAPGFGETQVARHVQSPDDLQRELAASVPVYLLVTRIDELAGMQRLIAGDPGDRFGFTIELSGAGAL